MSLFAAAATAARLILLSLGVGGFVCNTRRNSVCFMSAVLKRLKAEMCALHAHFVKQTHRFCAPVVVVHDSRASSACEVVCVCVLVFGVCVWCLHVCMCVWVLL